MTNNFDILKYQQELQLRAGRDAYKCTCHFLRADDYYPSPHGSGVFVKIKDAHFLFTAAHLVENLYTDIFIGTDKDIIVRMGGTWTMNQLEPGQKRKDDKLDIAILKLDDESVMYANKYYGFIDISEIGFNHTPTPLPLYTAVGFPASKSKLNKHKKSLVSKPFIFNTKPSSDELYAKLDCSDKINLIVDYDKQNLFDSSANKKIVGPDPFGMSGGGLWFVEAQIVNPDEKVSKKLVGILSEWPLKNRKVWICSKIDVFMITLFTKYPELK